MQQSHHAAKLARYRLWFYAAAFYNLLWGTFNILFPHLYFDWIAIPRPNYLPLWQVVGMFVLVYAPAYWWAAQNPQQHYHLIVIGLLGKLLGPVGFVWSLATGQLPLAFGWTLLLNDLIWWPAFIAYLRHVRMEGVEFKAITLCAISPRCAARLCVNRNLSQKNQQAHSSPRKSWL